MGVKQLRFAVVAGAAAVVACAGPGAAQAKCTKHKLPKGNPTVRQYREAVPTACGDKPASGKLVLPPPPSATPPAPPTPSSPPSKNTKPNGKKNTRLPAFNIDKRNPVSASVGAVTHGGNGLLIALLALMGASALAIGGMALYRRRSGAN